MFTKKELRITTAVSAALLAAGCGPKADPNKGWSATENTAVCTDEQGRRVDDTYCNNRNRAYAGSRHYGWYYIPRGGYVPGMGLGARGGSYSAPAGSHYTPASVGGAHVSRGGFGSSAHSFGGGGS